MKTEYDLGSSQDVLISGCSASYSEWTEHVIPNSLGILYFFRTSREDLTIICWAYLPFCNPLGTAVLHFYIVPERQLLLAGFKFSWVFVRHGSVMHLHGSPGSLYRESRDGLIRAGDAFIVSVVFIFDAFTVYWILAHLSDMIPSCRERLKCISYWFW